MLTRTPRHGRETGTPLQVEMTEEELMLELETMRAKARESENEFDMADSVLHGIAWSRIVLDEACHLLLSRPALLTVCVRRSTGPQDQRPDHEHRQGCLSPEERL